MSDWQPDLYLKYAKERTQPAIDLAARVTKKDIKTILDLGCGPGNSTEILYERWPEAKITGLDNSPPMLAQAGQKVPGGTFICRDANQDLSDLGSFDLVFSNAAIQWLPRHSALIHRMFALLNPGGILAVQVPHSELIAGIRILGQMAAGLRWKAALDNVTRMRTSYSMHYYYDVLSSLAENIELWQTTYLHIMDGYEDIVSWFSATALRPYLAELRGLQAQFLEEYSYNLQQAYHRQADKKILFPFSRIFFMAARAA